jgi:hypothetical protein
MSIIPHDISVPDNTPEQPIFHRITRNQKTLDSPQATLAQYGIARPEIPCAWKESDMPGWDRGWF